MCKKHHIYEKDYIWNPAICSCKNGKYFASIIDNSVITWDEIRDAEAKLYNEETKKNFVSNFAPIFNEKKQPVKHKMFVCYLHFY